MAVVRRFEEKPLAHQAQGGPETPGPYHIVLCSGIPLVHEFLIPFQQLGFPALLRNLHNLGYTQPTPIQARAIPVARSGRGAPAIQPHLADGPALTVLRILGVRTIRPARSRTSMPAVSQYSE